MKSPKNIKQGKNEAKQVLPKKYRFYLGSKERYITISSDFESGNIQLIKQISEFQFRLASVHDGVETGHKVNSKSWFYFCVAGFPKNTKGKFFITKVQTLSSIYYSKPFSYRPVFKVGETGTWQRIPNECELVMREQDLQCVFDYLFRDETEKVYFAFTYPFTYSDNLRYLDSLEQRILCSSVYFHKQIITKSMEGRDIHLLTITSDDHPDPDQTHELVFNNDLFPHKNRPNRFLKPVVLISARVHPGETASSFTVKGIINFLLSLDLRAKLLRKMFVFMIIPMINADGVYRGHFRMDCEGKNLNRYYNNPCPRKQPAIFAIKELANHLTKNNRLSFYFDLHAHNAKKGHFIYGNSISDFVEQVESQVFCKLIALNNKDFEYKYCNFTQRHMKAKDRFESLTKEGCGRVVMHRLAKIIHSYSVECGIVSANALNEVPGTPNSNFRLHESGLETDSCEHNQKKQKDDGYFTPEKYKNLGKNLMVSILDVFDKNPYNRVYNSAVKSLDMLRRMTAFEVFHEDERFRMFEKFVFGKVKNINDLIKEVLNEKLHYKKLYNFYFYEDKELKNVEWPQDIPGLRKIKNRSPLRKRFIVRQAQYEYSEYFKKALLGVEENLPDQEAQLITRKAEASEKQQEIMSKSSETQNFEEQQEREQIDNIAELQKIRRSERKTNEDSPTQIMLFGKKQNPVEEMQSMSMNMNSSRLIYVSGENIQSGDQIDRNFNETRGLFNAEQMFQSFTPGRSSARNSLLHEIREQIKKKVQKSISMNKKGQNRVQILTKMVKNFRIYSPKKVDRERMKTESNAEKLSPIHKKSELIARSFLSISALHN